MSVMHRIQRFLRSPQGQQATAKAKRYLEKPETQHRLRRVLTKFRGRH
jgi:hypothetical protein